MQLSGNMLEVVLIMTGLYQTRKITSANTSHQILHRKSRRIPEAPRIWTARETLEQPRTTAPKRRKNLTSPPLELREPDLEPTLPQHVIQAYAAT
jgi:hypothetical protein